MKKSSRSHKTVEIKVFVIIFAWWWMDPDPNPYLWLTDPGGPKTKTDPEHCRKPSKTKGSEPESTEWFIEGQAFLARPTPSHLARNRRHIERLRKRDNFLTGDGVGRGMGVELNHTTARKPGPSYSLFHTLWSEPTEEKDAKPYLFG